MKLFLIAALAAFALSAQTPSTGAKPEVKSAVAKVTPPAKPDALAPEHVFTEVESLKIQLAATQVALLNKKYNIETYQKEAQPFVMQQQGIFITACQQLGIPQTLMQTECGVESGVDADGKPKLLAGCDEDALLLHHEW